MKLYICIGILKSLYFKIVLLNFILLFAVIANAEVSKETLKNKITVILNEETNVPVIAATVFIKVGLTSETEENNGITNLMIDLLLKGTTTRDANKLAEEIESIGASVNSASEEDYSLISLVCNERFIKEGMELLSDAIKNPVFTEEQIEKQKKIILNRIKSREDDTFNYALRNFKEVFYEAHPYRLDVLGTKESLSKINRKNIVDHYNKHFNAENLIISISGNFIYDNIVDLLNKNFSGIGSIRTGINELPVSYEVRATETHEKIIKKDKKQSIILLGYLAPSVSDKDYAAFKVLNAILGGGMSSKLWYNLREKEGLAYEIGTFYPSKKHTSHFVFYAGTRKENIEKVKAGILNEVKKIKAGGEITQDDLQKAKNYIIGNFYIDHQRNIRKCWYLGWFELLGKGFMFDKGYIEEIKKVTLSDINRIINENFRNFALIIIEGTN